MLLKLETVSSGLMSHLARKFTFNTPTADQEIQGSLNDVDTGTCCHDSKRSFGIPLTNLNLGLPWRKAPLEQRKVMSFVIRHKSSATERRLDFRGVPRYTPRSNARACAMHSYPVAGRENFPRQNLIDTISESLSRE